MGPDENSHTAVGDYYSLTCSVTSRLVEYHVTSVQKHENHVTTTVYRQLKKSTHCKSATGKWSFVKETSQIMQLCQSFF